MGAESWSAPETSSLIFPLRPVEASVPACATDHFSTGTVRCRDSQLTQRIAIDPVGIIPPDLLPDESSSS